MTRVAPGSAPEPPVMDIVLVILTFQKPNAFFQHYMLLNENGWANGHSKLGPPLSRKGKQK